MPRLIINADDFGQAPGICRAVAELHDAGVLTSATLMANGVAFEEAVALAKARPQLGVGCHVVLLNGEPVLAPYEVRSLLGPDRTTFHPTLSSFVWGLASGKIREEEIEREAIAQIEKLQRAGIAVTHLDTHKHTHMFPSVLRPLIKAAIRCGVSCIRNSFEQEWSLKGIPTASLRLLEVRGLRARYSSTSRKQLATSSICTTDGCVGIAATGRVNAAAVEAWIRDIPSGTWEIACHPGYRDEVLARQTTRLQHSREEELRAFLSVIPRAKALRPDLELISFQETNVIPSKRFP